MRNARQGRPLIDPIYTMEDVEAVLRLCDGYRYRESIPLPGGRRRAFYDAGHILGSAIVEITLREKGADKGAGFSGDLGRAIRS